MGLKLRLKETACSVGGRRAQARFLPRYSYNFTPTQLFFLCQCLERTRDVAGAIVEIGCAAGNSTIFLNRFMDAAGIEKEYVCIDTFAGFTKRDIDYESQVRGKSPRLYGHAWRDWSYDLFRRTMSFNGIERVKTIRADVSDYDFAGIGAIAFCLVDVDLYAPVMAALQSVYPRVPAGGCIVVDDCVADHKYDGARQAYLEFVTGVGIAPDFRLDKLGVVPVCDRRSNEEEKTEWTQWGH
jgi:predicted O-methyltransferase YrrM